MPDDEPETGPSVFGERAKLMNIAFRMLGTTHDAEDIVQEAYARWYAMSEEARLAIESPPAWLVRVTGRICLDHLASARVRRERYAGEWLPEPLPDHSSWSSTATLDQAGGDPADRVTLDESVSMGMLIVLESVTPAERVAFIMHDVFKMPFAEIADIVGRTPATCRQLATSARRHIESNRHQAIAPDQHRSVVSAFKSACGTGNLDTLIDLLDPRVSVHTDGGGKVRSARRPILGPEKTARFFLGLLRKEPGQELTEKNVNGRPGLVISHDGEVVAVIATEARAGRITDIWMMVNPDKLRAWERHR
ncbi:RNA polymerase sigma factor SigJ [Streptosporangium sp. 'caverna']|uniref:RNA polymerase sigma factor SigJ n=1 Tax=Streptosporangium sp. 'caverna' TaxID=2202249 RepID=UPI000D7E2FA4|nr:RNA polymerase sigma factor SigJ [Streptosporangium sp. 'caverna']AWS44011.1 RNA polymerase subunit sigma-24 [Streptosporangium sp. 'caverna']